MRMKVLLLTLVFAACFSGCKCNERQRAVLHIPPAQMASFGEKPVHIEAGAQLGSFVGRRAELEGTVSETGVPQIQGVDLWGLEQFRGKRLLVSGVLQCTEVSSNDVGAIRERDSGIDGFIAPVYRGTGTFYRLQYAVYGYNR